MYDMWVEERATKKAWRLDHDETKKVYLDAEGQTVYKCEYHEVMFYPCCPKEAPKSEIPEHGDQLTIFDFI